MEQGEGLALLQEMFCTMDAALVRDVLHNVHGDSDKACHQLLLIQVIPPAPGNGTKACTITEQLCMLTLGARCLRLFSAGAYSTAP